MPIVYHQAFKFVFILYDFEQSDELIYYTCYKHSHTQKRTERLLRIP
jgi:hypothetical protein